MSSDYILVLLSLPISYWIRIGHAYAPQSFAEAFLFLLAPAIAVVSLSRFGLYRQITRHIGRSGAQRAFAGITLAVLIWTVVVELAGVDLGSRRGIPRSVILMFWGISFALVWGSRLAISRLLTTGEERAQLPVTAEQETPILRKILIVGLNRSSLQFAQKIDKVPGYKVIGFVSDTDSYLGRKFAGFKVYDRNVLDHLIQTASVSDVFIDHQAIGKNMQAQFVSQLAKAPVRIMRLPSFEEIVTGAVFIDQMLSLKAEDLLGRQPVEPDQDLLKSSVQGKVVLVTGAGGSIGSELCRQILSLGAARLILFDVSEAALYKIHAELLDRLRNEDQAAGRDDSDAGADKLLPVIGSVVDQWTVANLLKNNAVDTIFHAAAYKHVPLVEANPEQGLHNNVYGTKILAQAAIENTVERFVLISTDKAVRPTNVMGASKRLAEMVVQGLSDTANCSTQFRIVRFGNVLDSSGSVIPKFREQIRSGGPVTVTHPEVVRYFMSIGEAVTLVIQAGSMDGNGSVFVLDMGEPVKIDDLARMMIHLAGLSIRNEKNPDGDIAIDYIGLRPGEKLYEELLIAGETEATDHPRISRVQEPFPPLSELNTELAWLENFLRDGEQERFMSSLKRLVEGYQRETGPSPGEELSLARKTS